MIKGFAPTKQKNTVHLTEAKHKNLKPPANRNLMIHKYLQFQEHSTNMLRQFYIHFAA